MSGRQYPLLENFMKYAKLQNLGFKGPSFTWHRGGMFECLDMTIGNDARVRFFLNSMVTHLPRLKWIVGLSFLLLIKNVSLIEGVHLDF